MIKLDFEFQTQYGVYRDALYLEDNHSFTEQDIEAMKQERVDNWIAVITAPSEEVIEAPTEDIVE
jgi:hypothetical protein